MMQNEVKTARGARIIVILSYVDITSYGFIGK